MLRRRLQVADRAIGFAEGQILGGRARRDALDQLLDALHLLLLRPFGGGALFLFAVLRPVPWLRQTWPRSPRRSHRPAPTSACHSSTTARHAASRSGPRVCCRPASTTGRLRATARRAWCESFRAPGGSGDAPLARRQDSSKRARSSASSRSCADAPGMPSHSARAFSSSSGVSSPRRASTRSQIATNAARRAAARSISASRSASSRRRALDCGTRLGQLGRELSSCSGLAESPPSSRSRQRAPLFGCFVELCLRLGHRRRAGDRVEPRHHEADPLLPLLARGLPGRLGIVDFLDQGLRALGDRLVLRACRRCRRGARGARRRTSSPRRRARGR